MATINVSRNRETYEKGFVPSQYDGVNPGFVSARLYLDSLRNPGMKLNKRAVVALSFLSVLVTACSIGAAAPSPDQQALPTGSPMPDLSHTATLTATADAFLTPLAPLMSLTPTAALLIDSYTLNNYINNGPDNILSDYPSWVNASTDESSGVALTTTDNIKEYFANRADSAAANPSIEALDRMFAQLSLPINPDVFKQRQLNHDWTGFGMGFSESHLSLLKPLEELQQKQANGEWIGALDPDQYSRAWTLTNARNIDKAVLLFVDEFIRMNPELGGQRLALFDRITKGDFGIKEQPDDNDPLTINDQYSACETYSGPAATRSRQPELARGVQFNPDQEISNNGREDETILAHDSDNSMVLAMVADNANNILWVEARDLASFPDQLNVGLDSVFDGKYPGRWHGGRLVPCGVGAPDQPGQPEVTPPASRPTPMPTNADVFPAHPPRNQEPPSNPSGDPQQGPTEIP